MHLSNMNSIIYLLHRVGNLLNLNIYWNLQKGQYTEHKFDNFTLGCGKATHNYIHKFMYYTCTERSEFGPCYARNGYQESFPGLLSHDLFSKY